jgi:hypothetical protein
MTIADLAGGIIGLLFTLFVFSYLLGDNPLFKLAIYIFIGVASGYAAIVAFNSVLLPQLVIPLLSPNRLEQVVGLIPMILSVLLITKLFPRFARIGNISMAFLVGIAAATVIGGAVTGTLFPQIQASINVYDLRAGAVPGGSLPVQLANGSIILIGTVASLAYFHFGTRYSGAEPERRANWLEGIRLVGQVFIAVTLGYLFAGVYTSALAALIERLQFFVNFIRNLLPS